jgi:hypothetical protein
VVGSWQVAAGCRLDHPRQLGLHGLEFGHLGVDLGIRVHSSASLWPQGQRPWSQVASSSQVSRSRSPTRWALLMNRRRLIASWWYWLYPAAVRSGAGSSPQPFVVRTVAALRPSSAPRLETARGPA